VTTKKDDGLSSLVLVVGIYEGVLPFPSRWFGWHPLLSLPTRLDAPAWWIVSGAVVVMAATLLVLLDRAGEGATPSDSPTG